MRPEAFMPGQYGIIPDAIVGPFVIVVLIILIIAVIRRWKGELE